MIEKLIDLIISLLPSLLPDEAAKIQKEIDDLKEKIVEKKAIYLKAIAEMDIPTLNSLDSDLFGGL